MFLPSDGNRRNFRTGFTRRGFSPVRDISPLRRGTGPTRRDLSPIRRPRTPPLRRDFDRRPDYRRREPIASHRGARADARKYLPPTRTFNKYKSGIGPISPIRTEGEKRSRSPIRSEVFSKRSHAVERPEGEVEAMKLERSIRYDLMDIFASCIHADKATHVERLTLVKGKIRELKDEVGLMYGNNDHVELEEVDSVEHGHNGADRNKREYDGRSRDYPSKDTRRGDSKRFRRQGEGIGKWPHRGYSISPIRTEGDSDLKEVDSVREESPRKPRSPSRARSRSHSRSRSSSYRNQDDNEDYIDFEEDVDPEVMKKASRVVASGSLTPEDALELKEVDSEV
ncbi:unnamed protein product [Bursaphelenchus okinawaensis]|uniref:Uncharacterized protein n=1 Tax=Bursaphelenchus okinawaensis TaxID=465554 RepID=A0A811KUY9_9BILA|nr:unnamed protein product [Bursaphelenchus okinawaensis]CAG9112701.1 unnamed protein product [Bursaphelenchus okinawaensis]